MDTVYVKPAEGGRIRQPERGSRVMPPEGDRVPRDLYYERLIIAGDVVECEPPAAGSGSEIMSLPDPVKRPPPPDEDTRRR